MTNVSSSYRQITTYGRDTIRKFDANVSAMKKLAARDWEDLLQVYCSIILVGYRVDIIFTSAQSQLSKDFYPVHMMSLSGSCYLS
jgi:hypothetical protein